jgi:sulfatase maturation enzyme AslB (radical SAM superfamily)
LANIMLTEYCNLRCPYCFAEKYTLSKPQEMRMDHFKDALDFILTNPKEKIGLIGGEPTMYSKFGEVLDLIIKDCRVKHAVIFTNGTLLDRYQEYLSNKKLVFLINCNSPQDIGWVQFNKMLSNIDLLINKFDMRDNTLLGINIYSPDMDLSYIYQILNDFEMRNLRISVVVPQDSEKYNHDALTYFKSLKGKLLELFAGLSKLKVLPRYDCNRLPSCVWDEEEKESIVRLFGEELQKTNILKDSSYCTPVIDITTNLQAIRCFGCSQQVSCHIGEFDTIEQLKAYYLNVVDALSYNQFTNPQCKGCMKRKTMECNTGCLIFKQAKIQRAQEYIAALNDCDLT